MKKFFYKRTHIPSGQTWVLESEHHTERAFISSLVTWTRWADLAQTPIWDYVDVTADCIEAEVDLTGIAKATVEEFAERARQAYADSVVSLMEEYMLRELAKWQKKHPKRAVSIMDNQLTTNVHIDGETYGSGVDDVDDRMAYVIEPLYKVIDWYNKFADEYRVSIGGLTVAPEGYERQWIHERIEYMS